MLALSIALAMILSFVESQIPAFVAIPGIKVGLANIVVVFALYKLGWKEAAIISLIRVMLVSLLFGTGASFLYSLAGAVLSFAGMLLLKGTGRFSCTAVSVVGGVLLHSDNMARYRAAERARYQQLLRNRNACRLRVLDGPGLTLCYELDGVEHRVIVE